MNQNLQLLAKKLEYLLRMSRDLEYSVTKMSQPLAKIRMGTLDSLTLDERETVSAFTSRFSDFPIFRSISVKP